jgi:hypothetical protein
MTKQLKSSRNSIVVKGIIVPTAWDKMGNVTAVSISTFDEKEIPVSGSVVDIPKFLRKTVEAEGILNSRKGKRVIEVTRCRLLKGLEKSRGNINENDSRGLTGH